MEFITENTRQRHYCRVLASEKRAHLVGEHANANVLLTTCSILSVLGFVQRHVLLVRINMWIAAFVEGKGGSPHEVPVPAGGSYWSSRTHVAKNIAEFSGGLTVFERFRLVTAPPRFWVTEETTHKPFSRDSMPKRHLPTPARVRHLLTYMRFMIIVVFAGFTVFWASTRAVQPLFPAQG